MQANKPSLLKRPGVQTLLASLICIVLGLLVGYIALLIINPSGATDAIISVMKNFWAYSKPEKQLKNFGVTLVTTAPLLMCSLSVLFAYKVGLFNIGASGQYTIVMPDQDAVVSIHAGLRDMQQEINLVWEHLLPAFGAYRLGVVEGLGLFCGKSAVIDAEFIDSRLVHMADPLVSPLETIVVTDRPVADPELGGIEELEVADGVLTDNARDNSFRSYINTVAINVELIFDMEVAYDNVVPARCGEAVAPLVIVPYFPHAPLVAHPEGPLVSEITGTCLGTVNAHRKISPASVCGIGDVDIHRDGCVIIVYLSLLYPHRKREGLERLEGAVLAKIVSKVRIDTAIVSLAGTSCLEVVGIAGSFAGKSKVADLGSCALKREISHEGVLCHCDFGFAVCSGRSVVVRFAGN